MSQFIVITSIHGKTEAMERYEHLEGWKVIVVGDAKSTPVPSSSSLTYLSLADQEKLPFASVKHNPHNHYARKNIGYLYALQQGAEIIYDTDDDNVPLDTWNEPATGCDRVCTSKTGIANVYRLYSDTHIWPRGFPLENIHDDPPLDVKRTQAAPARIAMWQGLAQEDPDVDAIYRMLFSAPHAFRFDEPVFFAPGTFCPSNSQCTFWRKEAFPFMYLPMTVGFRFTDILRGYIAQRLLWERNLHLGCMGPIVRQERNFHDLRQDFRQEVECHLAVPQLLSLLQNIQLPKTETANGLLHVITTLSNANIVDDREKEACQTWLEDVATLGAI